MRLHRFCGYYRRTNFPSYLAWTDAKSHCLHFLVFLFQNEFLNAPSNCLYEQMQSCIGYFYAVSFSKNHLAPRTCVPQKMRDWKNTPKSLCRYDAACIYKIKAMVSQGNNLPWGRILPNIKFIICNFPHCALQMQIHINCICTIFLQN